MRLFAPSLTRAMVAARAGRLLAECARLAAVDRGAARLELRRRARLYQQAFVHGCELHGRLLTLLVELERQPGAAAGPAPVWEVVPWDQLGSFADLVRRARSSAAELLCLVSFDPALQGDAVSEAEALAALGGEARLALVTVGEAPPLLLRRAFVLEAAGSVAADTPPAHLAEALIAAAARLGRRTCSR